MTATCCGLLASSLRKSAVKWGLIALVVLIEVGLVLAGVGYEWFGGTFRLRNQMLLSLNLFAGILRRKVMPD